MPTSKKRTNISLPDDVDMVITFLAKRDDMPKASKAAELIKAGLELEEDALWDALAEERDKKGIKFVSHKSAWK